MSNCEKCMLNQVTGLEAEVKWLNAEIVKLKANINSMQGSVDDYCDEVVGQRDEMLDYLKDMNGQCQENPDMMTAYHVSPKEKRYLKTLVQKVEGDE